ncbi:MAG TPA: hypothetical protein VGN12_21550 [Pirellulales bacterium]|jgi:hypothetical protein
MSFFSREVRWLRVAKAFAVLVLCGYLYIRVATPSWTELRQGQTVAQAVQILGEPTDTLNDDFGRPVELWYSAEKPQFKLFFRSGQLVKVDFNGPGKGYHLP